MPDDIFTELIADIVKMTYYSFKKYYQELHGSYLESKDIVKHWAALVIMGV